MDQGARHEMRHSAACTCGAQESRADRVARYPALVSIRFAVLNITSTSTRCSIRMSAYRAPVSTWNRRIMYAARPVYATVEARAAPVSYTHLRAHETRHDLVCRLLLEKKKKKNTEKRIRLK